MLVCVGGEGWNSQPGDVLIAAETRIFFPPSAHACPPARPSARPSILQVGRGHGRSGLGRRL